MATPSAPATPALRNVAIALAVGVVHAAAIWALQSDLATVKGAELLVPVSLLALPSPPPTRPTRPTPPRPRAESPPPGSKPDLKPKKPPELRPAQRPEPATLKTAAPNSPAPNRAAPNDLAPTAEPNRATGAPAAARDSLGSAAASPQVPAAEAAFAPGLQLPSTHADHLRNPKPAYPALSRRLSEQGTVVHSVLIAADGRPVDAKLVQSSGFDRLDKASYDAVMQWRYVPGKRQGVPEAMRFEVPIRWVLE